LSRSSVSTHSELHGEISEKASAMANALPEETFYFDDIPAYVEAARERGWKGICFQDREQAEREMKAEGMVWA